MKLRIDTLPEEGMLLWSKEDTGSYPILAEMAESGECRFGGPIHVSLRAKPVREMIEAKGQLEASVHLGCRRCLREFPLTLKRPFRLYFTDEPDPEDDDSEEGKELSADDIGLIRFRGDTIDFTEAIQEQVVLALPDWALCAETCQGLCPRCGTDLNQGSCGCDTGVVDDRFAVLKNLKLE